MSPLDSLFEIVTLKTGTKSLRSLERKETFHPGTGPLLEANILHVQQQRLVERASAASKFVLWDVGFGAAANVVAAIEALQGLDTEIEIHSFDKSTDPIEFSLRHGAELEYILPHEKNLRALLAEKIVELRPGFRWHFHLGNFQQEMLRSDLPTPQAIFYDPYSPVGNIEMWTLEHFAKLKNRLGMDTPYLLSNYTRSTAVRVTWLLAGFAVGIGCIIGEKEETSIATNRLDLLERPLNRKWLERVKISHNSAPMRGDTYAMAPISAADLAQLERLPQFQV